MRRGQQRNPSLEEVIRAAVESYLDEFFVAMPGRVTKYNQTKETADVQPLLKRTVVFDNGEEEVESFPIVTNVPVMFPRTSQFFMTFPLAVGDNVLLLVNDRSIDAYTLSTGLVEIDPVDLRQHDLSDAVCFPGFFPATKPRKSITGSAGKFAFGFDSPLGAYVTIDKTGKFDVNGNFTVDP